MQMLKAAIPRPRNLKTPENLAQELQRQPDNLADQKALLAAIASHLSVSKQMSETELQVAARIIPRGSLFFGEYLAALACAPPGVASKADKQTFSLLLQLLLGRGKLREFILLIRSRPDTVELFGVENAMFSPLVLDALSQWRTEVRIPLPTQQIQQDFKAATMCSTTLDRSAKLFVQKIINWFAPLENSMDSSVLRFLQIAHEIVDIVAGEPAYFPLSQVDRQVIKQKLGCVLELMRRPSVFGLIQHQVTCVRAAASSPLLIRYLFALMCGLISMPAGKELPSFRSFDAGQAMAVVLCRGLVEPECLNLHALTYQLDGLCCSALSEVARESQPLFLVVLQNAINKLELQPTPERLYPVVLSLLLAFGKLQPLESGSERDSYALREAQTHALMVTMTEDSLDGFDVPPVFAKSKGLLLRLSKRVGLIMGGMKDALLHPGVWQKHFQQGCLLFYVEMAAELKAAPPTKLVCQLRDGTQNIDIFANWTLACSSLEAEVAKLMISELTFQGRSTFYQVDQQRYLQAREAVELVNQNGIVSQAQYLSILNWLLAVFRESDRPAEFITEIMAQSGDAWIVVRSCPLEIVNYQEMLELIILHGQLKALLQQLLLQEDMALCQFAASGELGYFYQSPFLVNGDYRPRAPLKEEATATQLSFQLESDTRVAFCRPYNLWFDVLKLVAFGMRKYGAEPLSLPSAGCAPLCHLYALAQADFTFPDSSANMAGRLLLRAGQTKADVFDGMFPRARAAQAIPASDDAKIFLNALKLAEGRVVEVELGDPDEHTDSMIASCFGTRDPMDQRLIDAIKEFHWSVCENPGTIDAVHELLRQFIYDDQLEGRLAAQAIQLDLNLIETALQQLSDTKSIAAAPAATMLQQIAPAATILMRWPLNFVFVGICGSIIVIPRADGSNFACSASVKSNARKWFAALNKHQLAVKNYNVRFIFPLLLEIQRVVGGQIRHMFKSKTREQELRCLAFRALKGIENGEGVEKHFVVLLEVVCQFLLAHGALDSLGSAVAYLQNADASLIYEQLNKCVRQKEDFIYQFCLLLLQKRVMHLLIKPGHYLQRYVQLLQAHLQKGLPDGLDYALEQLQVTRLYVGVALFDLMARKEILDDASELEENVHYDFVRKYVNARMTLLDTGYLDYDARRSTEETCFVSKLRFLLQGVAKAGSIDSYALDMLDTSLAMLLNAGADQSFWEIFLALHDQQDDVNSCSGLISAAIDNARQFDTIDACASAFNRFVFIFDAFDTLIDQLHAWRSKLIRYYDPDAPVLCIDRKAFSFNGFNGIQRSPSALCLSATYGYTLKLKLTDNAVRGAADEVEIGTTADTPHIADGAIQKRCKPKEPIVLADFQYHVEAIRMRDQKATREFGNDLRPSPLQENTLRLACGASFVEEQPIPQPEQLQEDRIVEREAQPVRTVQLESSDDSSEQVRVDELHFDYAPVQQPVFFDKTKPSNIANPRAMHGVQLLKESAAYELVVGGICQPGETCDAVVDYFQLFEEDLITVLKEEMEWQSCSGSTTKRMAPQRENESCVQKLGLLLPNTITPVVLKAADPRHVYLERPALYSQQAEECEGNDAEDCSSASSSCASPPEICSTSSQLAPSHNAKNKVFLTNVACDIGFARRRLSARDEERYQLSLHILKAPAADYSGCQEILLTAQLLRMLAQFQDLFFGCRVLKQLRTRAQFIDSDAQLRDPSLFSLHQMLLATEVRQEDYVYSCIDERLAALLQGKHQALARQFIKSAGPYGLVLQPAAQVDQLLSVGRVRATRAIQFFLLHLDQCNACCEMMTTCSACAAFVQAPDLAVLLRRGLRDPLGMRRCAKCLGK